MYLMTNRVILASVFILVLIPATLLTPHPFLVRAAGEDMTMPEFYDAVKTKIKKLEADRAKFQKEQQFAKVKEINKKIKLLREGLGAAEFIMNPEESRGLVPSASPTERLKQLEALEQQLTDEIGRLKRIEEGLIRTVSPQSLATKIEPIHEQLARADVLRKFIQANKNSLVSTHPQEWKYFISPRSLIIYLKEHGIPFQQILEALARFMKETKGGIDLVRMGEIIRWGARIGLEVGKGFLKDLPYLIPLEAADVVRQSSERVIKLGDLYDYEESIKRALDYFKGFITNSGQRVTPIDNPQVFNLTPQQVEDLERRKASLENQLRIIKQLIKRAEQRLSIWDWLFYGVRRPSTLEEQQRAERAREEIRNIHESKFSPQIRADY